VNVEVDDGKLAFSASGEKTIPNDVGIIEKKWVPYPKLSNEMLSKNSLLFHSMDVLPKVPKSP
jgi:hypothetical protein